MSPRPTGGVWILDRDLADSSSHEPRFWALDRYFRVESVDQDPHVLAEGGEEIFQPKSGPTRNIQGRSFPSLDSNCQCPPLSSKPLQ